VFSGPNLPEEIWGASIVPTPDGTGVAIIYGNNLFELDCSTSACNWSAMEQELIVWRQHCVAMYVPDSFVVCEN
jgi:hypothetical protein